MYGCVEGNVTKQADAEQAYIQARFPESAPKTWVALPREAWPKSWEGMVDPVVPLNPVHR